MTYSLIDDKYIYTYKVEETNKKVLLDILKEYSQETVVEFNNIGPAGIIERTLISDINKLYDEIIEYDFNHREGNGRYSGDRKVNMVAIVKKYPVLYRILNSDFNPASLLMYLNNVGPISSTYKQKYQFQLVNAIHQCKENNQCNYNYDSHIDMDTKLDIIKKYISGLDFKLIDKKALKELKEEKAFLSKMESNEHQIALLKQIDDKIKRAHDDTKNLNDLMQLLNLEKENKLVKTK